MKGAGSAASPCDLRGLSPLVLHFFGNKNIEESLFNRKKAILDLKAVEDLLAYKI